MKECLLYPLPGHWHLSSLAKPRPPYCHFVSTFCLPPTPYLDDVIHEQPLIDMTILPIRSHSPFVTKLLISPPSGCLRARSS